MAKYKVYDENDNLIGEFIEDAKESVSDSLGSGEINWAAFLGLILLFVFLWILSLIWAILWPVIKFIGRLLWWLLKLIGLFAWWLLQEVAFALWWLVRLPFTTILYKETPEWWFPDWTFPEW